LTNIESKEDLFKYCNLGDTGEIQLKISKSDLAAYIGTAQASLSRIFKKFSVLNLMKISGKRITIINRQGLMNYLNG
jgi:CRP-like cAMP-binding protein